MLLYRSHWWIFCKRFSRIKVVVRIDFYSCYWLLLLLSFMHRNLILDVKYSIFVMIMIVSLIDKLPFKMIQRLYIFSIIKVLILKKFIIIWLIITNVFSTWNMILFVKKKFMIKFTIIITIINIIIIIIKLCDKYVQWNDSTKNQKFPLEVISRTNILDFVPVYALWYSNIVNFITHLFYFQNSWIDWI